MLENSVLKQMVKKTLKKFFSITSLHKNKSIFICMPMY